MRRLHLKDAILATDNADIVQEIRPLGAGTVPYHRVLGDLMVDGFTGCAAVQTHMYGREPERLRAATLEGLRALKRLLEQLAPAPSTEAKGA